MSFTTHPSFDLVISNYKLSKNLGVGTFGRVKRKHLLLL